MGIKNCLDLLRWLNLQCSPTHVLSESFLGSSATQTTLNVFRSSHVFSNCSALGKCVSAVTRLCRHPCGLWILTCIGQQRTAVFLLRQGEKNMTSWSCILWWIPLSPTLIPLYIVYIIYRGPVVVPSWSTKSGWQRYQLSLNYCTWACSRIWNTTLFVSTWN